MISANPVEEKLDEARYFLQRMEELKELHEEFKYNLSAFLSAARSVTFVLRRHYKHRVGFDGWYDDLGLDKNPVMAFLNMGRVTAVHKGPVPVGHREEAYLVEVQDGVVTVRASDVGPSPPEWIAKAESPFLIHKENESQTVSASASVSDLSSIFPWFAERDWTSHFELRVTYLWMFEEHPGEASSKNEVVELCAHHLQNLKQVVTAAVERFGE